MPEMTFTKVVHGVTRKLAAQYPDANIYDEEIPQELDPPAFFVRLLNPTHTQELNVLYRRFHPVVIHYFDPDKSNTAMYDVANQLMALLEYIEIDGQLYSGTGMNYEIVDLVLHFFVDYNFMVRRASPEVPDMQSLDLEEGLKE